MCEWFLFTGNLSKNRRKTKYGRISFTRGYWRIEGQRQKKGRADSETKDSDGAERKGWARRTYSSVDRQIEGSLARAEITAYVMQRTDQEI